MATDFAKNYKSYNDDLDLQFLQDGWVLDDKVSSNLHESKKLAFDYMNKIVQEYGLPEELI